MDKPFGDRKLLQFNRQAAHPKAIASTEQHGFASDIFHNPDLDPPTWHFIISRLDNAEILYWGQERSLERAQEASRAMLSSLVSTAKKSGSKVV
ncbi:MAG TPA: hypothetical protein VMZ25_01135 [Terriglobales bacterium]|nr:hypothetical protein [Terriglobales bacterium]